MRDIYNTYFKIMGTHNIHVPLILIYKDRLAHDNVIIIYRDNLSESRQRY